MSAPTRTPEGKWVLYDRVTGERLVRWPVDARGMLESGGYTAESPDGAEPSAAPEHVAPSIPAPPYEHPLGVAPVLTTAETASPGQPMSVTRSSGKPRDFKGARR
jgi:hypothetical protein